MKMKKSLSMLLCTALLVLPMSAGAGFADDAIGTTVKQTIVPVAVPTDTAAPLPNDVEHYTQMGYGISKVEKGFPIIPRTDLMPPGYKIPAKSDFNLLKFFTMSDVHIVDIQSPTQPLYFGEQPVAGMSSAYSASILYTTQTLNSAVKSINRINAQSKLDFGLMLGDATNSAQKNELTMYLNVLTGRLVNPNSDLTRNFDTDYTQTFKAEGLNMPWYQVLGNHDHFWSGVYNANDKLKNALSGNTMMRTGAHGTKELEGEDTYGGIIDVSTIFGKIIGSGPSNGNDSAAHQLTPNVDRQFNDAQSFVDMFPSGHGLTSASKNPLACYTFEPKSDVPVRVIVLDDTPKQDETFYDASPTTRSTTAANGSLDRIRFEWLKKELKSAQTSGKLIIVAVHIPTGMKGLWSPNSEISEAQFIGELHKYSNMMLLLAGHRHMNTVIAYPSPDVKKPELGFWQVETASLRDFPQQFRLFDIHANKDGTVSILTTDSDPIAEPGSMMEKARSYAIAASQIFPEQKGMEQPAEKSRVYNAELFKKLSPEMAAKLAKLKK